MAVYATAEEVELFLRKNNISFDGPQDYGNGKGVSYELRGDYRGTKINSFNTGKTNAQGKRGEDIENLLATEFDRA